MTAPTTIHCGIELRRWAEIFDDLVAQIFEEIPGAREFDPCSCGITIAVVPADVIELSKAHGMGHTLFPIYNEALRARALAVLQSNQRAESQYEGADGVLVLGERA